MLEICCKTESKKSREFMKMQPRAPCRPMETESEETEKSEGQFSGFKDHIANLNPGLYHLIKEERTFLDAFEALSPGMRNVIEREFRKYTGRQTIPQSICQPFIPGKEVAY